MKDDFKLVASLIGDPVRATVLWELLDGKAFTATELAIAAETSASNISMHLSKLMNAGLLAAENQGRHRYYKYATQEIAYAVEALSTLIPPASKKMKPVAVLTPIQQCRTCYDHLAGKTGVAITDAMLQQRLIVLKNNQFNLTKKGRQWFNELHIDATSLQLQRRSFLRPCLDWSERRYHMAGSLAAAFLNKMLQQDWLRATKNSRVVIVTAKGQQQLYNRLKVVIK
ncbi:ArsR/SmtB family transcription factor [Parafilimonas sp.]|uniref:ArsR/SmtB family transcription factor n=1 Tax=Parafilimonas sp. TaxID=1969739 RepID=UPI0039E43B57